MLELLKDWILQIVGAAILTAVAMTIAPEGKTKRAVRLVCGVVMLIAMMSIVKDFDFSNYGKYLADCKSGAEYLSTAIDEENDRLSRTIIEEECETYILDKGSRLGLEGMDAAVRAEWSENGFWYPDKAEIRADSTSPTGAKSRLEYYIEADLGIQGENIIWRSKDES